MSTLTIGLEKLSIEEIVDTVNKNKKIALSENPDFREKLNRSRKVLENKLENNETVYGVTTGYGDSCVYDIPKTLRAKLPLQLTRYHQCGLGDIFDIQMTKLIQISRITSLVQGFSGVRVELLEFMVELYNKGITPRIPQEGSVGASGDLTPLSYYAATLVGEGHVFYQEKLYPTMELYEELGITPIVLAEKEALALMNGTAVMTALACYSYVQAEYLASLTSRLTALSSVAQLANSAHFNKIIFKAKPHQGTIQAAKLIRNDLTEAYGNKALNRLQDRYSIRCAPHIIGVLFDALTAFKPIIETELNSANDNPLIDIENDDILHGGNFYGGHIAFAMDSLKILVANIADLVDRQMALIVDPKFNNGLPPNLSAHKGEDICLYHGLKALQISASAWTAEALKHTTAASIFSRSTECHNQDKVSMGTIAARDLLRIIELTEQVICAGLVASTQGIQIRLNRGELSEEMIGKNISNFMSFFRKTVRFVEEDRPLEGELRDLMALIKLRRKELVS